MTKKRNSAWELGSWRKHKQAQQPEYQDQVTLDRICDELSGLPPLVFSGEVERLKQELAEAAQGKRFILQGGDCAERFVDCHPDRITSKLKILLQMSLILIYGTRLPITRIGRIAGQYGKPRSNDTETIDGVSLPVFRGDNVNSFKAEARLRQPDPARLLQGYMYSALTINFIRALLAGGFADLHSPEHWNLTFFANEIVRDRYSELIGQIKDAISFVSSVGASDDERLRSVPFYTSHEGLILPFEQALTRTVPVRERYYDLSAHMLWIGERTRALDGAHVEFFRGVANPIGVKIGPTADPEDIVELANVLNPEREPGKIVLISRLGHEKVSAALPRFIRAVRKADIPVVWSVDPMHGNMIKTSHGIKTRDFDAILSEIEQSFVVHRAEQSILASVHFEMTGDDVTECTGGAEALNEDDLTKNYETYCDPRLNYSQSLEMAFLIASKFRTL